MRALENLRPQPLWNYFEDICQVPRPSKKEGKIIEFLLDFAKENNLEAKKDSAGNVLITKPAVAGKDGSPTVVLQSHVDMVCEKNAGKIHDFDKDPVTPVVDGSWVRADGTTLGADCGIGMAAQMAVLTSENIKHGPVECLFTVDEETGLTGAHALNRGFISGKVLLNLDSGDEGELFIGCAGGIDTVANIEYTMTECPKNYFAAKITVNGLLGGHSGDDINKGRANAIKILNRFLFQSCKKYDLRLAEFNGGNLRNAIAREAYAIILIPFENKEDITADLNIFREEVENEIAINEPKAGLSIKSMPDNPELVMRREDMVKLIYSLYACPHGVISMSSRMPGMVETSTNLASVKFTSGSRVTIATSQRSNIESAKYYASNMVESVFNLAGATVNKGEGYPGWAPDPNSKILNIANKSYKKLFGNEPVVRSVHAGLECGLFLQKYPDLDMISFGPSIRGAHSPDEKIEINSVDKFWKYLADILEAL